MTLLVIAHRELLAAAHKRGTFRLRMTVVGLATLLTALVFLFVGLSGAGQQSGRFLFNALVYGCLVLTAFSGLFLTADSVAQERRDGTLGLLFLTNLNGLQVVLGKLAATGIHAISTVFAVFPFVATAWFLGGITVGEFIRSALTLLISLLLSLSVGLCVSVYRRSQGQVIAFTGLMLVWIYFVAWLLSMAFDVVFPGTNFQWLAWSSPWHTLLKSEAAIYRFTPHIFWYGLLLQLAISGSLLVLASIALHRNWRHTDPAILVWKPGFRPRPRLQNPTKNTDAPSAPSASPPASEPSAPPKIVGQPPIYRKRRLNRDLLEKGALKALFRRREASFLRRTLWVLAGVSLLLSIGLWIPWIYGEFFTGSEPSPWKTQTQIAQGGGTVTFTVPGPPIFNPFLLGLGGLNTLIALLAWLIVMVLASWEAVHTLADARRTGALELMLTTPLRDRDFFLAQRHHLYHTFLPPMAIMILAEALDQGLRIVMPDLFLRNVQNLFFVLLPFVQLFAIAHCGAWFAIKDPRPMFAFGKTFLLCGMLPPLLCCFGIPFGFGLALWGTSQCSRPLRRFISEPR